jgi:hypothetical protein
MSRNTKSVAASLPYRSIRSHLIRQLPSSLRRLAPQLHHAKHQRIAGNAKQSRDTHISPPIVSCVNIQCLEVIRSCGVRTVLARSAVVRIGYVACIGAEEFGHVISTRCAGGQGDLRELVWPALDLDVVDDGLEETADQVGEGVEVVHLKNRRSASCSKYCDNVRR